MMPRLRAVTRVAFTMALARAMSSSAAPCDSASMDTRRAMYSRPSMVSPGRGLPPPPAPRPSMGSPPRPAAPSVPAYAWASGARELEGPRGRPSPPSSSSASLSPSPRPSSPPLPPPPNPRGNTWPSRISELRRRVSGDFSAGDSSWPSPSPPAPSPPGPPPAAVLCARAAAALEMAPPFAASRASSSISARRIWITRTRSSRLRCVFQNSPALGVIPHAIASCSSSLVVT